VETLADRARARTDDPVLLATAALHVGRLSALTRQHAAGFNGMAAIAGDLAATHPTIALDALAAAAVLRFYSGEESQRRTIDRLLPRLPAGALREWARIVSDPFGGGRELASRLPDMIAAAGGGLGAGDRGGVGRGAGAGGRPERLTALAIAAWVLDETPLAVRTFDEAVQSWHTAGPLPEGLGGVIALAYFEYGRWDQARAVCAALGALPAAAGLGHAVACAHAIEAMIVASQGDAAPARALADEALRLVDPLESRSVAVYAHRALTAAAMVEGDHEAAYEHARRPSRRGDRDRRALGPPAEPGAPQPRLARRTRARRTRLPGGPGRPRSHHRPFPATAADRPARHPRAAARRRVSQDALHASAR
jgi:hypothetical protein